MKKIFDDHLTSNLEPSMEVLCTWLGQIPVGQQVVPDRSFPSEWASFSADEWDKLVSSAQQQGLAPLLYWVLSKSGIFSSIPESARNSLRTQYSGTWKQNQQIFKELEVLTNLFYKAEIPVVVLKGACYAFTIYPDDALRPM
jgi:hypothetical protein